MMHVASAHFISVCVCVHASISLVSLLKEKRHLLFRRTSNLTTISIIANRLASKFTFDVSFNICCALAAAAAAAASAADTSLN